MQVLAETSAGLAVPALRSGYGGRPMEDLKSRVENLLCEAADCEMIGNLATDKAKRDLFRKLASDLRMMARNIEALIVVKSTKDGSARPQ